jgi:hypothetical protein
MNVKSRNCWNKRGEAEEVSLFPSLTVHGSFEATFSIIDFKLILLRLARLRSVTSFCG